MARAVLTRDLEKRVIDELRFGLASEILCATEHWGQGRHP